MPGRDDKTAQDLYALHKDEVAVTFTGGIDSTTLAYELADSGVRTLVLLFANYGQANANHSRELLKYHAKKLGAAAVTVDVGLPPWSCNSPLHQPGYVPQRADYSIDYTEQRKSYDYALIDGRNAFLFLYMLSWCSQHKIPVLYTGHQYEPKEWAELDSYRHRTEDFGPGFIDRMNLLQEVGFRNRVRIEAPFIQRRLSKREIIKLGLSLGIDIKNQTYSCQFYPACGKCDNCICRENALRDFES